MSDTLAPFTVLAGGNEAGRRALALALRQAGLRVVASATGPDALCMAGEKRPDLILLLAGPPYLTGAELRRLLPDAAIPVLSVAADLGGCRNAGLAAPADPAELAATVQALLRGRRAEGRFDCFLEAAPDAVPTTSS